MKYSTLFGKTRFGEQKGSGLISHQLLSKAGFIAESVAGRYFFMPLGWRVHDKIKAIIKQEMDRAGAQEMLAPTLHPLELWQETNRTNTAGFELMKVEDRRGAAFALGGTAEEMFVDVVRKWQLSYKDLPFNIYQFSNKFRDEMRARGGLLRVREFVMKDAYSFHRDEEDFKKEYDSMADTYTRIFQRLGLETRQVAADNGYIGGEYCHEFQVEHPEGEGRFFVSEDGSYCAHEDVAAFYLELVNPTEEVKDFQIVDQPEWVQTMDENVKHYGKDKRHFLKNVVYVSREGDIIIGSIRGDLEVNKTKLEQALDLVGQLETATDEDLAAIGTKTGYVHSWGHQFVKPRKAKFTKRDCQVIYVADLSLKTVKNFIGGQKEAKTDSFNVNYGRDFQHDIEADIAMAQDGFLAPDGKQKLVEKRGIEVGNIFQLGLHYSTKMKDATFTDQDGKAKPYYMGCYGIGLGRTLATIAEKYHDDRGLVWPEVIAPFQVHLISLKGREEDGANLYRQLVAADIEVLWDDRNESPGVKFSDADLIGNPIRLVISQKSGDKIEWKLRNQKESELVDAEEVIRRLTTHS
jgi:prolyl-tRNA synthetase